MKYNYKKTITIMGGAVIFTFYTFHFKRTKKIVFYFKKFRIRLYGFDNNFIHL